MRRWNNKQVRRNDARYCFVKPIASAGMNIEVGSVLLMDDLTALNYLRQGIVVPFVLVEFTCGSFNRCNEDYTSYIHDNTIPGAQTVKRINR